jgi:integrase
MTALELERFVENVTSTVQEDNRGSNAVLVGRFVNHCQASRGRSAATVGAYESLLGMYLDHVAPRHLFELTTADMEVFVNRPRMKRGAGTNGAAASRKRDANMLRTFYKWAWEQGLTDDWLAKALHGPTVPARNPRPIPDAAWLRLWQADLSVADRVTFGLGFFLGLRVAEIATLSPDQVADGVIVDFVRKGGGEDTLDMGSVLEVLRLSSKTRHLVGKGGLQSAIEQVQTGRTGAKFLLPYHGRGNNVSKRFTAVTSRLGLGHLTAHQMRHSAATNLIRAGLPLPLVKEVMNHSNIHITMGYVKAGGAELKEWLSAAPPT